MIATGAGSGSSGGLCASSALAGSAGGASGPTAASSAGGASKMGSFLTGQVLEKCDVLKNGDSIERNGCESWMLAVLACQPGGLGRKPAKMTKLQRRKRQEDPWGARGTSCEIPGVWEP